MKKMLFVSVLVLFVFGLGIQLSAQDKPALEPEVMQMLPDLVVTKCEPVSKFVVVVTVENQGTKTSPKCKLVVEGIQKPETSFDNSEKKVVKFKKLPGKHSISHIGRPRNVRVVRIICPFKVYSDAKIRVTIDPKNKVKEVKEDNNTCLKNTWVGI